MRPWPSGEKSTAAIGLEPVDVPRPGRAPGEERAGPLGAWALGARRVGGAPPGAVPARGWGDAVGVGEGVGAGAARGGAAVAGLGGGDGGMVGSGGLVGPTSTTGAGGPGTE
jgi:hypothetical protein